MKNKGYLVPLADYYEEHRSDGESAYKFVPRKIDEGVFKLKERAMHYHFANGTGFVFVPIKKSEPHTFLMEGIVRDK